MKEMKNVIIDTVISVLVGTMMLLSAMVFETDIDDMVQLSWFIISWISGSIVINMGIRSLFSKRNND